MGLWIFNKYRKLKREDVVDAMVKLEQEQSNLENQIISWGNDIDDLKVKGKNTKDRQLRLFYAKKINMLQAERERSIKRASYIMYNTRLLNQLKQAIDDKEFFADTGKVSLNNLLNDQKGLAQFLNKALNTRIKAEDVLTSADETFNEVEAAYSENEQIYGVNQNDDKLLAMFEDEESADMDDEIADASVGKVTNKKAIAEDGEDNI